MSQDNTFADGSTRSSLRFKDNVQDMTGAERLYELRPVNFTYKKDAADAAPQVQYGLIAEEVVGVIPLAVACEADGTTPHSVQYSRLVPFLIDLVQKQNARLEILEAVCQVER